MNQRPKSTDNKFALAALLGVVLVLSTLAPRSAFAGAFIFAGEGNGVDIVTHPEAYTGAGGAVNVTICVDPTSANANAMVNTTVNMAATFTAKIPTTGNVLTGSNNNVPSGAVDWESVALHEVGHCIGLAHANLATESGLTGANQNYTKSTNGADNAFKWLRVFYAMGRLKPGVSVEDATGELTGVVRTQDRQGGP